jgi:hypothetical protein
VSRTSANARTGLRAGPQRSGKAKRRWDGRPDQSENSEGVVDRLNEKIATIDWKAAAADVERFLGAADRESLKIWSTRFFSTRASQLPSS